MDPDGDTIITLNDPGAPFATSMSPGAMDPPQDDLASEPMDSTPHTFLVSSRHLILASPVFKKMLTGSDWSEANKVEGQFRVDASEWDPAAFAIVLNLVHGWHRRTPKSVTLETLANIAAIVDYYEFYEAVEVACSSWVSTLRVSEPIPEEPGRKLYLWMLNAWVFGLDDIFKSTTKAAILHATSVLEAPDNLPIPAKVFDRMNENRQAAITSIVAGVVSLRKDYEENRKGCNWACACLHFGVLHKLSIQMNVAGDLPCDGKCLREIVYALRDMRLPRWRSSDDESEGRSGYYRDSQPPWHQCPSTSFSKEAFDLGFSKRVSSDSRGIWGIWEDNATTTSRFGVSRTTWVSSEVLLESLSLIITENRTRMMGLTLGDFARPITDLSE
ncbi:hypothetical protein QBC39DRAFT_260074 [Podospora conica]|nr:hypothetical protein QBC39DRAFT_260074 [Schizothecium conicum]